MKWNAYKTKTMIASRSGGMYPLSQPSTIGGTLLKDSDVLDILGVTIGSKMTFEKHHCSVSTVASQQT